MVIHQQGQENGALVVTESQGIDRVEVVSKELDDVTRFYQGVLTEGQDYGVPEGMYIKKPFLFLAGIEKVKKLHKLRSKYSIVHVERNLGLDNTEPFFYYEIKCELVNEEGRVVAEGNAVSHTKEDAYFPGRNGKKSHGQLALTGANRCRKMGDIRACRSAIKEYGMLSHIFNIDEDTFDAGQQNAPLDPARTYIENMSHVQWLVGSTGRSAQEIASILQIKKWGDWTGTLMEAYNAIILSSPTVRKAPSIDDEIASISIDIEALRERIGGNISDDLLLSFLGVSDISEFSGTLDEAERIIKSETASLDSTNPAESTQRKPREVTMDTIPE